MWPSRSFFHLRIATEGGASSAAHERLLPVYLHINEKDLEWFRGKKEEIVPSVCELVSEAISDIELESQREGAEAITATPNRLAGCPHCIVAYTTAKRPRYDVVSLDVGTGGGAALKTSSFVLKLYVFPLETEANDINNVFL